MQKYGKNPKMSYAKHGLNSKMRIRLNWSLILGGEGLLREEEMNKEMKRRRRRRKRGKVWKLGICMEMYAFL